MLTYPQWLARQRRRERALHVATVLGAYALGFVMMALWLWLMYSANGGE